jgi:hypothetical protein
MFLIRPSGIEAMRIILSACKDEGWRLERLTAVAIALGYPANLLELRDDKGTLLAN